MFDHENISVHWVNRLGFAVRKELANRFLAQDHNISPEEWAILLVLWKKGAQSPSTVADVTTKDRTTITRLIDGMVRKNLVTRTENEKDRRRSVIDVSQRGESLKSVLIPIAQSLISDIHAGLTTEDIETTTRALKTMHRNLAGASKQPANT